MNSILLLPTSAFLVGDFTPNNLHRDDAPSPMQVELYILTCLLLHGCQVFQNHRPDHSRSLGIRLGTAAALFDLNRPLRVREAD
jgi:hypothetical protein